MATTSVLLHTMKEVAADTVRTSSTTLPLTVPMDQLHVHPGGPSEGHHTISPHPASLYSPLLQASVLPKRVWALAEQEHLLNPLSSRKLQSYSLQDQERVIFAVGYDSQCFRPLRISAVTLACCLFNQCFSLRYHFKVTLLTFTTLFLIVSLLQFNRIKSTELLLASSPHLCS